MGFNNTNQGLCSYGVGTEDLSSPLVNWCGDSTYIQKTGINNDLGVFAAPDEFYKIHHQEFSPLKGWLYRNIVRHWMNSRVEKIRKGKMLPKKYKSPMDNDHWVQVIKTN